MPSRELSWFRWRQSAAWATRPGASSPSTADIARAVCSSGSAPRGPLSTLDFERGACGGRGSWAPHGNVREGLCSRRTRSWVCSGFCEARRAIAANYDPRRAAVPEGAASARDESPRGPAAAQASSRGFPRAPASSARAAAPARSGSVPASGGRKSRERPEVPTRMEAARGAASRRASSSRSRSRDCATPRLSSLRDEGRAARRAAGAAGVGRVARAARSARLGNRDPSCVRCSIFDYVLGGLRPPSASVDGATTCFPILFRDRIVGRIEPAHRSRGRAGCAVASGPWWGRRFSSRGRARRLRPTRCAARFRAYLRFGGREPRRVGAAHLGKGEAALPHLGRDGLRGLPSSRSGAGSRRGAFVSRPATLAASGGHVETVQSGVEREDVGTAADGRLAPHPRAASGRGVSSVAFRVGRATKREPALRVDEQSVAGARSPGRRRGG